MIFFASNSKDTYNQEILEYFIVTEADVLVVIDKLGVSKAPGPDSIHACIIKNVN